MSTPALLTADHEREGATPARREREGATPAAGGRDLAGLLGTLQRSAGNQAINGLLRQYASRAALQRAGDEAEEQGDVQRRATAGGAIQRDGPTTLPPVPHNELTVPAPGAGAAPPPKYQLQLDPQIQAAAQVQAMMHVQQQLDPGTLRGAITSLRLGPVPPLGGAAGAGTSPAAASAATPSAAPASPVPAGPGPETPHPADTGDLMDALLAVPVIDTALTDLRAQVTDRVTNDWARLSTGERVGVVSSLSVIAVGALGGVLSNPEARRWAVGQFNGRVLPVPGVDWLHMEVNTQDKNLMVGLHVDVGALLPAGLGFGPSSPTALGGPPAAEPGPPVARALAQRASAEDEQEQGGMVQAAPEVGLEGGPLSSELSGRINARRGGGSPLDGETRTQMEGAFGTSFGGVSVHTDGEADALNRSVSAVAFTTGSDIFFRQGAYQPGSPEGRQLLAHELTHVVQQQGTSSSGPLTVGPAGDSHEREAEATSAAVARMTEGGLPAPAPEQESLPGAGAPVARALQRQTVVDLPRSPAPAAPLEDPAFAQAHGTLAQAAQKARKHPPAKGMVKTAQEAAPTPANDALSKAQVKQAGTMSAAEPAKPDKNAFLAMLRQKLDAIAPKNDNDLKEFKSSGKAAQMQADLKGSVQGQRDKAQGAIAGATAAPPPTGQVTPREPGPAPAPPAPAALPQVDPNKAVPPPAPDPGPAMAENAKVADTSMAEAKVTTEQLQKANDPRFSAVVEAKDQVHAHAATAPEAFKTQQQEVLAKTGADAQGAVAAAQGKMQQAHAAAHAAAHSHQQEVMNREAQERQKVATHVSEMFTEIKTKVEAKLKGLNDTVDTLFTAGEKSSRDIFEAEVDRRVTEYWLDHPFDAFAGWVTEKDPNKERIWHEERDNYMKRLDNTLESIADRVERELKEAKDIITQGHAAIDAYVAGLAPNLRASGQQAEQALSSNFTTLQNNVDAQREELADHLVDRYQQAQQAIDARVKELEESQKGILSAFKEKLEQVKKAIDEFKKRLQGVVADAEETLDLIIKDPMAFLGHLLDALKTGFGQFASNILTHLKKGLMEWIFGAVAEMGIQLPDTFDLKGIIMLVLQVLGVTWERIKGKIEKIIGPKAMKFLTKIVDYVQTLINGGIEGLWEKIKEDLSGLKDMVIEAIESWIIETIVKQAIAKLVTMSNPAGAIIEAVITIYKTVMFFIEKAQQILTLVETIVRSVSNIAHGNISEAANWVERAMASTIPLIIGFLADLLGLGGLSHKVQELIKKAQDVVDKAIDKALAKIVSVAKKLFGGGKDKDDKKGPDQRTDAEKDADIGKAYAKVAPLVQDASKKPEDVKKALPEIKGEFKLSTLDMKEEPAGESKEKVTVTGTIQRNVPPVTGTMSTAGAVASPIPVGGTFQVNSQNVAPAAGGKYESTWRTAKVVAIIPPDPKSGGQAMLHYRYESGPQAGQEAKVLLSAVEADYNKTNRVYRPEAGEHKEFTPRKITVELDVEAQQRIITFEYTNTALKDMKFTMRQNLGDYLTTSARGENLRIKPVAGRGETQEALTHLRKQAWDNAHLIADWFGGSGYRDSLNLISTSQTFNRTTMATIEREIAELFREYATDHPTLSFDMEVNVEWGEFVDAKASASAASGLKAGVLSQETAADPAKVDAFIASWQSEAKPQAKQCKNVTYIVTYKDADWSVGVRRMTGPDKWIKVQK